MGGIVAEFGDVRNEPRFSRETPFATMQSMTGTPVRTRFAPSPTGHLHAGNARTAVLSALLARRQGGDFLLRIEDTDRARSQGQYVDALVEDLTWLGLVWDEGPGARGRGDGAGYFQSQRTHIYRRYLDQLVDQGLAYPCFCGEDALAEERALQRAVGRPPRYSGRCRELSPEQRAARLAAGGTAALRFAVAGTEVLEFEDLVRGPQRMNAGDIGDFVIRRSDGAPAFFFTNAVDDALMGITHVLRGEDHLTNTPRQILLLRALGMTPPRYGHLGLVVDAGGAPLSKRRGDVSLRALRAQGYLPLALLNYLVRLGFSGLDGALYDFAGLATRFDETLLARGPAQYDEEQLGYWQRQALQRVEPSEFWTWCGREVQALVPPARQLRFMQAVRGNAQTPAAVRRWAEILFTEGWPVGDAARDAIARAGSRFFCAAIAALHAAGDGDFPTWREEIAKATGCRGKALFAPLRAALTGELEGPEVAEIVALLGPAALEKRLGRWCQA